jgi:hypothetical protein
MQMMACINPSHWDRGVMMLCARAEALAAKTFEGLHDFQRHFWGLF